ncbi:MAG TPA: HAMP domain-containing sensor histidine kinase [Azospirillum sp.]|nr:HAMP domain-containing sensor histidine kinase [Azospirillum sp.]
MSAPWISTLLRRAGLRRPVGPWALLAALAVAIVAGYVALAGGALWREHDRTREEAARNAQNLARLVAGVVGYAMENVSRELELIAHGMSTQSRAPAVPPPLTAVAVLDGDGALLAGAPGLAALPAARGALRAVEGGRLGVHAGPPGPEGQPMLLFTHRAPQGLVVASMPARALNRLLRSVELPGLEGAHIALSDGTPVVGAARPANGDDEPRLVVRQAVSGTGLVVSLSQPWSAILAGWRATAVEAALVGVAVATGVLVLTVALFLWMRRMQAAEEARRAAEAASRAKSDFLALMSHELRTPLNTVLGFAEMIRDRAWGPGAEDRYVEYAGDIHAAGTHLLSVLNDVLDLAKIEAGRMALHPEPLSAADLAQACYRLSSGQARASGVEIAVAVAEDAGPLYADPRAARQMIVNLLSNACKFTPRGGRVRLEIRDGPRGGMLVTVSDTGCGMTPEGIVKALQRFGQVDNLQTRAQTGTGLGLPLVKGLVELHGGSLAIDSTPGQGTTVTLAFPPPPLAVTAKAALRFAEG